MEFFRILFIFIGFKRKINMKIENSSIKFKLALIVHEATRLKKSPRPLVKVEKKGLFCCLIYSL